MKYNRVKKKKLKNRKLARVILESLPWSTTAWLPTSCYSSPLFFLVLPDLVCIAVFLCFSSSQVFFLFATCHKIPLYTLQKQSFFFRKPSLYNSKFPPNSLDRISTLSFLLPLFRPSSSKCGPNLQFFQNPSCWILTYQNTSKTFLSMSFPYSPRHFTISRIGSVVSFPSKYASSQKINK